MARAGPRLRSLADMDVQADRPPLRRRVHDERAGIRQDHRRRRPAAGQAVVHGQHRRCRQRSAQLVESAWQGLGVRARRGRPPAATQAADAAVPRQEHQELREDLRTRRRCANRRTGRRARRCSTARADDADHAQRDPARRVRRRRRTARRASAHHPAVGHAGFPTGGAAHADANLRPLQPVGQAGRIPAAVRRSRRQADRPRQGRPEPGQPRRRARAAAAQHIRGRFGDVPRRTSATNC